MKNHTKPIVLHLRHPKFPIEIFKNLFAVGKAMENKMNYDFKRGFKGVWIPAEIWLNENLI